MSVAPVRLERDVQVRLGGEARIETEIAENLRARFAKELTVCRFEDVVETDHDVGMWVMWVMFVRL